MDQPDNSNDNYRYNNNACIDQSTNNRYLNHPHRQQYNQNNNYVDRNNHHRGSQNFSRSNNHFRDQDNYDTRRSNNYGFRSGTKTNYQSSDLPPRFARNRQINSNENSSRNNHQTRYRNNESQQQIPKDESDIHNRFNRMDMNNGSNSVNRDDRDKAYHDDDGLRNIPSTSHHRSQDFHQRHHFQAPRNRGLNDNTNGKQSIRMDATKTVKNRVKSDLESQREIMDELLRKAQYECIICCDMIRVHDRTWNCNNCFNVFHLKCTQQWARKSSIDPNEASTSQDKKKNQQIQEWRCPTCQSVHRNFPNYYHCFCGKLRDPEVSNYRVPHSCGEMCSKNLELFNIKIENEEYFECKHRCTLMCHPGKCPPCTVKVERICSCRKTKMSLNCAAKLSDIKCSEPCNKLLDCGKHRCQKNCHFGRCDPCEKIFEMKCYCGKESRQAVSCIDLESGYCCEKICSKPFECGSHKCEKLCHSGSCGSCPLSPESVTKCPCGNTSLSSIANQQTRKSCLDPISNCGKICDKILPCGSDNDKPHRCKSFCHSGECPACDQTTIIRCYCGANSQKINCKNLESKTFKCKRKCNKKLSCGRHKCLKECCTEKEHPCRQTCGRKLICGKHTCEEQCHQVCRSCPNVIWDEITCNCGQEKLFPPQPCGTLKPPCKRPCSRNHGCDHTPLHPCHDEPECPPCIEFVSRLCYGGHEVRESVHCYENGVSCGRFCQKPLPCGLHKCSKICHDGECPVCIQRCIKIRPDCLHQCGLPCHQISSEICPESPCHERIKIYCECEYKSKEVECSTVLDSRQFQRQLDDILRRFSFNSSITLDEMKEMVRHNAKHSLECDQDCAREKRNRNLADALGVDSEGLTIGANLVKYSDQLKNEARSNPQFIMNVHDKFVQLLDAFNQSNQKIMCYNFQPMNRNNREIIHNYAAHFGLKTESVDKEPNRSIVITANKNSSIPKTSLLEAVNIDVKDLRPKQSIVKYKKASEENRNKKVINYFDD